MTSKTALYRHWNGEGKLLYVGISIRPFQRLDQHAYGSHWADDIEKVTIEYFDTRREAEAAERKAIKDESPLHNIVHAIADGAAIETETRKRVARDPIPQRAADDHVYRHATHRGQRGTDPDEAIESASSEPLVVPGRPMPFRITPERAEGTIDRLVAEGRLIRSLGGLYPPFSYDYVHKLAIKRYLADNDNDEAGVEEAA